MMRCRASAEAGVAEHRPLGGRRPWPWLRSQSAWLRRFARRYRGKDWLAANKMPDACAIMAVPRKKAGAAKAFMVRSGSFADADIAITWHPSRFWEVVVTPSLANTRADFSSPARLACRSFADLGRSALDALELMNVA